MNTEMKKKTNDKAVASLTLGILSILITVIGLILGIISIVLYAVSKKEIRNDQEAGYGIALAGLICSIVGVVIQILAITGIITFVTFSAVSVY